MLRTHARTRKARLTGLLGAVALAAAGGLTAAAPASADGVTAKYLGHAEGQGMEINVLDKDMPRPYAGVLSLDAGNGVKLPVYCIDYRNPVDEDDNYTEGEWPATWLGAPDRAKDGAKVKWILNNSFPKKQLTDLKKLPGLGDLDPEEAGAATQAAIWHFSDKIDLDKGNKDNPDDVKALYDYLVNNAKDTEDSTTKYSLEFDKPEVSGKASAKPGVGPLTLSTTAEGKTIAVKLGAGAPAGTKLVDKDGAPVTKAGNGDQLYVAPPAGTTGQAKVEASGTSTVETGRVFLGTRVRKGDKEAAQLLILAGTSSVEVKADALAKWAPEGPLPEFAAEEKCADGGVEVTTTNKGDAPFTFTLDGKQNTVEAGKSVKQLIKVQEDQAYTIKIVDKDNKTLKEFSGVLDCKPASTTGGSTPTTPPAPAPSGPELAKTGGSDSNSALYMSGGAVLLLGGGLVFFVVRRRASTS